MVSGGGAAAAVSYRRPCRAGPRPEAAARSGRCVAAHLWPLVRRAAPTALPRPAASAEPPPPHGRPRAAPRRRERAARGLRAGAAGSNGPQPASAWGCPSLAVRAFPFLPRARGEAATAGLRCGCDAARCFQPSCGSIPTSCTRAGTRRSVWFL